MDGDYKAVISCNNGNLEQLIDKEVDVKEHHEKRTLSQNSYAWSLINQIADVLNSSKEEVYQSMLERYAPSERLLMLAEINPNGYFKYFKPINKIVKNNRDYIQYEMYKGSSEYDTKEMTHFIDGIISECKVLGIETMTPEEIAKLKLI